MFTRTATAVTVLAMLASCVAAPPPPPVPLRRPPPVFAPAPAPPAIPVERPFTPGSWRYAGGVAQFGNPVLFEARCDQVSRAVLMTVTGARAASVTVRASTSARAIAAVVSPSGSTTTVGASDPIVDAMAFSRGSFAVIAGATLLTIPARPEFARVVEDCRG